MMSIQLMIWNRLITNQTSLSSHYVSKAMPLLPSHVVYAKPHLKFPNFCIETGVSSIIPPDKGVVAEFFLNKCSLTEEDITKIAKAFKPKNSNLLLRAKSAQNCEKVLELLNGCGLTTPAQIRRVTLRCPIVFFYRSESKIKSKLSFFRTFMKEEDVAKLLYRDARVIMLSDDRLKSAVSLLRTLGFEGEALSEALGRHPHFLMATEKYVRESFKIVEDLGFKRGSRLFAYAVRATLGVGKEKLDRRRLCFGNLGFSEKQILDIFRRQPLVLSLSEEKVKRNGDFLVNSVGLSLDDIVKNPAMFGYSLEKRMIPRYRVMKALESMQLLKTKVILPSLCSATERVFLEKYIHSNGESSSVLLDIYHGGKVGH